MTTPAQSAPAQSTPAARYSIAAARFSALLAAVPSDAWEVVSPCEGWTVGDVASHVVSTERDFLGQRSLPAPDAADGPADAAWPAVRDAVQAALDDPAVASTAYDGYFGPTTIAGTLDQFYTLDLVVHRWDVATALGLTDHASMDDAELHALESNLAGVPEEVLRTPGLFGPAVDVPADASRQVRALAHFGRHA